MRHRTYAPSWLSWQTRHLRADVTFDSDRQRHTAPHHTGRTCSPKPTPPPTKAPGPRPLSTFFLPLPWRPCRSDPRLFIMPSSSKLRCCQGSTRAPILQSAWTTCYAWVSVTQALLQSAKMLVQRVLLPKGGCVCFFFFACCIPITSALGFLLSTVK